MTDYEEKCERAKPMVDKLILLFDGVDPEVAGIAIAAYLTASESVMQHVYLSLEELATFAGNLS